MTEEHRAQRLQFLCRIPANQALYFVTNASSLLAGAFSHRGVRDSIANDTYLVDRRPAQIDARKNSRGWFWRSLRCVAENCSYTVAMRRVSDACRRLAARLEPRNCSGSILGSRGLVNESAAASMDGNRSVLRLAGRDLYTFLQGLLTNDVLQIESGKQDFMYSAMLNPQGRFMYDMFLLSDRKEDEPIILMDVESQTVPELTRSLIKYRLRAAVDISNVSNEYEVKVLFGNPATEPSGVWHVDPRLPMLGFRTIVLREDSSAVDPGSSQQYVDWRIEHGVAEGCIEIPCGSALPLEYNLDGLSGISFTKGCYVGQELTARTKYTGVVRKRLLPVELADGHDLKSGDAIYETGRSKRSVGQIRLVGGAKKALAHLRLSAAFPKEGKPAALRVQDNEYTVLTPLRPTWWDPIWGREEE